MTSSRTPHLTAKLQGFGTTIFAEMSALAVATGSVNLGQGFPDTDGPAEVLEAAKAAIDGGMNQYPPGPGMKVLRDAIVQHQQRFYGIGYDADSEVLVTAGATEALAGALLGLLDTGDEVVVFDPMFDSYAPCIGLAGAVVKPVLLRPPSYSFDPDELRAAITPKTRLILFNSPHNPTGPICHAHSLHMASLIEDMPCLEVQFEESEQFHRLADQGLPRFRDGMSALPSGPGLGVGLHLDSIAGREVP